MDDRRFDDIVRAIGDGSSRRAVVRRLGIGLAGLFAGAAGLGLDQAAAKRRAPLRPRRVRGSDSPQRQCKLEGRPCSFDTHCCAFDTAPTGAGTCCNKRCCGEGQVCRAGRCVAATTTVPPTTVPPRPVCTAACGRPGECTGGCICAQSVEGTAFCISVATGGNCNPPCTSSAQCGGGFCATATCCGGTPQCIPAANICGA